MLGNKPLLTQQGFNSLWGNCEHTTGPQMKWNTGGVKQRAPDGHTPAPGPREQSVAVLEPLEARRAYSPHSHTS